VLEDNLRLYNIIKCKKSIDLPTHATLWDVPRVLRCKKKYTALSYAFRALEWTYKLKTASPRGHCELAHFLDAESLISSSTVPQFLPHSFSEPGQDLQVVLLINRLTLRYPVNHDYASDDEEIDHHCLSLRLAHSCFFHSRWSWCLPKRRLPLGLRIVLKYTRFIICDDMFKHFQLFCDSFHDVRANTFSGCLFLI
jgi:hypothetical protein